MALQDQHNQSQSDAIFRESLDENFTGEDDSDMMVIDTTADQLSPENPQIQPVATLQTILTFSNAASTSTARPSAIGIPSQPVPTEKARKQCVVCLWYNCRRKNTCAGAGNRPLCHHSTVGVPTGRIYKPGAEYRDREMN